MSDVSRFASSSTERALRGEEKELIRFLLSDVFEPAELENTLATARVRDMNDGGMGSIRFIGPGLRRFGKQLTEAEYLDRDGVLLSIAVNADRDGNLFEVDFWKVDFSPLKRYPKPSGLTVKPQ
jgi:hypothetical protein